MKKTKLKRPKKEQKESLIVLLRKLHDFVGIHAFVIVFVFGGLAIGFALVRARSYLNPIRDDDRYTEASAKLNFNKVDQKILNRLKLTQDDADVQVKQSLVPNRSNPFNE